MEGYTNFPKEDFEKHVDIFYPLAVELLNRELGSEVRLGLQALLRRIGEVRLGLDLPPMAGEGGQTTPGVVSPMSPRGAYFSRRGSRGMR